MRLKNLRNKKNLKSKVILVRIDANVPIKKGKAIDGPQGKIARAAVGLEWLRQRGARIVVMSHLGRPKGRRVAAYSLAPVARRLSQLLGGKVRLSRDVVGARVEKLISKMQDGDILLLENLRFNPGEEKDDKNFAKQLASSADFYVNDAFASSHRAHASTHAITKELPVYAGPLLMHETQVLGSLHESPKKPFILVVGGLKMGTKLPILNKFLPKIEKVLVGGALANAFLVAKGYNLGKSVYDKDSVAMAKKLLKRWNKKICIPHDVTVVSRLSSQARLRQVSIKDIQPKDMIIDIGKDSLKNFNDIIRTAHTIVWNGPIGYCEVKKFCYGTHEIARTIASRTGRAKTIVGGGDTLPVLDSAKLGDMFTLVSTGGGAMLEFLSGNSMPGINPLKQ